MNPYISAPKNLLYFSLFFLTVAVSIAVIAGISVSIISTAGVVLVVPVAVAGITLPVIICMEIIVQ